MDDWETEEIMTLYNIICKTEEIRNSKSFTEKLDNFYELNEIMEDLSIVKHRIPNLISRLVEEIYKRIEKQSEDKEDIGDQDNT